GVGAAESLDSRHEVRVDLERIAELDDRLVDLALLHVPLTPRDLLLLLGFGTLGTPRLGEEREPAQEEHRRHPTPIAHTLHHDTSWPTERPLSRNNAGELNESRLYAWAGPPPGAPPGWRRRGPRGRPPRNLCPSFAAGARRRRDRRPDRGTATLPRARGSPPTASRQPRLRHASPRRCRAWPGC